MLLGPQALDLSDNGNGKTAQIIAEPSSIFDSIDDFSEINQMYPLWNSPFCRPERSDPHPGWLHHGCHGRVLRTAHRRGEGSIPGPDEPERCGSALQRHHAGLQTDIPAGGLPRPLERFPPPFTTTHCSTADHQVQLHFILTRWTRSRPPLSPPLAQGRCPTSRETHW